MLFSATSMFLLIFTLTMETYSNPLTNQGNQAEGEGGLSGEIDPNLLDKNQFSDEKEAELKMEESLNVMYNQGVGYNKDVARTVGKRFYTVETRALLADRLSEATSVETRDQLHLSEKTSSVGESGLRSKRDDDDDETDDSEEEYNMECSYTNGGCYGSSVYRTMLRYGGMFGNINDPPEVELNNDQCCPSSHFFVTNNTLVNRDGIRRQIVKIDDNVQLFEVVSCASSSAGCAECIPQPSLTHLLVWDPELVWYRFPPMRFEEFQFESYCLCKSARP